MNTSDGAHAGSKPIEVAEAWRDDERWALALRIASSKQLFKALQLREILLYLCQRVLSDPATAIREYEIGCTVLGRRADFNPNDDNIVRVQISHLRKKLDEYFNTEGQAEPLILSIPKGSYAPRFDARLQTVIEPVVQPVVAPVIEEPPVVPDPPARQRIMLPVVLMLVLVILAVAAFIKKQAPTLVPPTQTAKDGTNLVWSDIFNPASPPSIVVADSCLALLQDTLGTDLALADYVGGHYPESLLSQVTDEPLKHTLTTLAERQYTSLGDVDIASGLMALSQKLGAAASIHYARHLNIRDFQSGNFVLIGSRRGNPWVGLFEPQLNFALTKNPQAKCFYFHNRQPKAGEAADYQPVLNGNHMLESYADVALVPNLGKNGYVLMLNGITMETSEAAGQLLMRQDFPPELAKIMRSTSGSPTRSLEILVRVRSLGGAASNSEIVCYRTR